MGRAHRSRPAHLGEKLKRIRTSLALTLEQIIELLDYKISPIYPTNISAMERGEREPPLLLLLSYARLIGISTDVLIDDEQDLPKDISLKKKTKGNMRNLQKAARRSGT